MCLTALLPWPKSLVSVLSEFMKKLKFEISMDVEDSFVDDAKRLEHHADGLLDLDSYPEIKSVYGCQVSEEPTDQELLAKWKLFYNFLRGKGHVELKGKDAIIKDFGVWTKKSHLPELTDKQAFLAIYILQEFYGVIPSTFERCSKCGELYDSEMEDCCD